MSGDGENQLTPDEARTIKDMVTSNEYRGSLSQHDVKSGASTRIVPATAADAQLLPRIAEAERQAMMLHEERNAHPTDLRPPPTPARVLDRQHPSGP